ncbi:MAG: DUF1822 family protein [Phormidium sp.]|nr:MAG: Protein of unknown function (DUF1822) [Phormidium sp. OSCR]
MNYSHHELTFNVPITQLMRSQADQVSQYQDNPDKLRQVYRNILVVLAVDYYCQCMGIKTNLESSTVWNPGLQLLANSADLELKNLGRVECCALLKNQDTVMVSREAQYDKLGYIAVVLDEDSNEAILRGFSENLVGDGEVFSLQDWDDLDLFLLKVEEWENQPSVASSQVTQLSQWLRGWVDAGWQSLEALIAPEQPTPAWVVRGPMKSQETSQNSVIKRGKLLHFEGMDEAIALLISLDSEISQEMDISVEIQSLDRRTELPLNLEISILNDEGQAVMQALAKSTEHIKLNFSGQPQEEFGVKVALGPVSFLEHFVI